MSDESDDEVFNPPVRFNSDDSCSDSDGDVEAYHHSGNALKSGDDSRRSLEDDTSTNGDTATDADNRSRVASSIENTSSNMGIKTDDNESLSPQMHSFSNDSENGSIIKDEPKIEPLKIRREDWVKAKMHHDGNVLSGSPKKKRIRRKKLEVEADRRRALELGISEAEYIRSKKRTCDDPDSNAVKKSRTISTKDERVTYKMDVDKNSNDLDIAASTGETRQPKRQYIKRKDAAKVPVSNKNGVNLVDRIPHCDPKDCVIGPWGSSIPTVVLLKIFRACVEEEGVFPFLFRARKVCDLWRVVASDSSLWTVVDLSMIQQEKCKGTKVNEDALISLCRKQILVRTVDLNLSGWGNKLSPKALDAIGNNCKNLQSLNLSGCMKIHAPNLMAFVGLTPHLSSLDISHISDTGGDRSPVSANCLRHIVSLIGPQLRYINLSGNFITGLPGIVAMFGEHCENLEGLDMSNMTSSTSHGNTNVNVEELQHKCPKLKVLRFANTYVALAPVPLMEQAQSPGFPELEELSVAKHMSKYYSGLDDDSLHRIVKNSAKLKLLDVRGCSRISASGLLRVPAIELKHLFLSQCPATMETRLELVFEKWRHSLVDVDLSWNIHDGGVIDSTVSTLASSDEDSPLVTLNLCGLAVSFEPVKNVLLRCRKLRSVNLSSCRGLPRGIKRLYEGADVDRLRQNIEAHKVVIDSEYQT